MDNIEEDELNIDIELSDDEKEDLEVEVDEDLEEVDEDLEEVDDELDEIDDELDVEDELEEEVVIEELEEEIEEIEEIEELEVIDDAINIADDNEEYGSIGNFNEEQYSTKIQKRNKSIQRYCKSSKDMVPRKVHIFKEPSEYLVKSILAQFTSDNNARKFSTVCPKDRDSIYQLCGKFINKEYNFSTLYEETKQGVSQWASSTFKKESDDEIQEIKIMTIKLPIVEGLYQCSKCKSKKTFSRQVQTRSADEGMTNIIQCAECNKVWREYS